MESGNPLGGQLQCRQGVLVDCGQRLFNFSFRDFKGRGLKFEPVETFGIFAQGGIAALAAGGLVLAGSWAMLSTICCADWPWTSRPQLGQWGVPTRA